ncbi:MAG: rhodanese-like domain-containing protein [Chitinophagales bacterium]
MFSQIKSSAYKLMLQNLLQHSVNEISVEEAHQLQKNNPQVQFLDSRSWREYEVSHVQNALWIGYDDFEICRVENIDYNTPVVVYCSVGYRSEKIAEKLLSAGFTQVYNMYGGLFEWSNEKFPMQNSAGLTQNIHPFDAQWGIWISHGNKVY